MKNLSVCKITSENNNKQYLASYFYKYVAFLIPFIKELACSVIVHTFFDWTGNAVDETAATFELIHYIILTFIYIECHKTVVRLALP